MKKLRLYLETSVWNFYFAKDVPFKREITRDFFEGLDNYDIFISDLVLEEIDRADERKRQSLVDLVSRYAPLELLSTSEAQDLARKYIAARLISVKAQNDALHIAIGVTNDMDVIVSWNMRHIVRLKTRLGVNAVNKLEGYKELEICTPEEMIGDED